MEMIAYCKAKGTRLLGPGSIGIITPEAVVGWLGGNVEWANTFFKRGSIGVFSRSGGQSGTIPRVLREGGFGVSTVIHTGTEPVLGTSDGGSASAVRGRSRNRRRGGLCRNRWFAGRGVRRGHRLGKFTKPFVVYVSGAGP